MKHSCCGTELELVLALHRYDENNDYLDVEKDDYLDENNDFFDENHAYLDVENDDTRQDDDDDDYGEVGVEDDNNFDKTNNRWKGDLSWNQLRQLKVAFQPLIKADALHLNLWMYLYQYLYAYFLPLFVPGAQSYFPTKAQS